MRAAASLRVRVVDAEGRPARDVMLWMLHEQDDGGSIGIHTDDEGEVELDGMLPGTCTLSASDEAHGFGVLHGVALLSGEARPVELALAPAAHLYLRVPDALDQRLGVTVRRAGRRVTFVIPGAGPRVEVPPGDLEVELTRWTSEGSEVLATRRVTARVGEETVVELDAP